MYERGDSREAMAAALGMTVQAIQYRLKEAGVTPSRRTPRWEAAQGWPWPLTLADVAQRLYGAQGATERRRARTLVNNWLTEGKLVRVGWAQYDLAQRPPPE